MHKGEAPRYPKVETAPGIAWRRPKTQKKEKDTNLLSTFHEARGVGATHSGESHQDNSRAGDPTCLDAARLVFSQRPAAWGTPLRIRACRVPLNWGEAE